MWRMEKPAWQNGVEEGDGEGQDEDLMFRVNFMPDEPVKLFQRDYQTLGHIQVRSSLFQRAYQTLGHIQVRSSLFQRAYQTLGHIQVR